MGDGGGGCCGGCRDRLAAPGPLGQPLAQVANQNSQVVVTDTPAVGETLLAGEPVVLADEVSTSEALQVQLAVQILESLGITLTDIAAGVYQLGAVETVQVLDSLARFFGADLEDAVSVTFEQASVALACSSRCRTTCRTYPRA